MKGLTVFEINTATGEIKKAEYRRGSVFISNSATHGSRRQETFVLVENPDCVYREALNLKNAKRKFKHLTV